MLSDSPVLVVGSGPTGLSLALDLLQMGISVRLIDAAPGPSPLSKAVVLMPRTLEAFELRGFVKRALDLGEPIHSFSAYSKGRMVFHTQYEKVSSRYNYLINLPQSETEMIIREELAMAGGTTEWSTSLAAMEQDEHGVLATIRLPDGSEETAKFSYLVGCDGAHSTVRHALDFKFAGEGYHDTWLLGDVHIDWKFRHGHGYCFFGEDGLLAIFPLKGNVYRIYIVQPLNHALGREPKLEDLMEATERIAPGLCKLSNPGWMSEFRCHHRKVAQYRKGRVLLAGDAAHIHSPETGLGMNTGIQDAYNLAWKIAAVLKKQCVPELLNTYHDERSFVGDQVLQLSDFTHRMSAMFGLIGRTVREPLWRFFSRYYSHHYENVEMGLQTRIHYKPNKFLTHYGRQEDMRDDLYEQSAGLRCIDGDLMDLEGGETTLHRRLGANRFHLLIFAGNLEALSEVETSIRAIDGLPIEPILLLARQDVGSYEQLEVPIYLDPEVRLHFTFGAQNGALFLIRPDGYIGFSSQPIQPAKLAEYVEELFLRND